MAIPLPKGERYRSSLRLRSATFGHLKTIGARSRMEQTGLDDHRGDTQMRISPVCGIQQQGMPHPQPRRLRRRQGFRRLRLTMVITVGTGEAVMETSLQAMGPV